MIYYIGLGSNVGDREAYITWSIKEISVLEEVRVLKRAQIYESPPLILETKFCEEREDKAYLNTALMIETELAPESLLFEFKKIEKKLGRKERPRWSARVIDIDILAFEKENYESDTLSIPHKQAHERNFVLAPLRDLNSNLKLNEESVLSLNRKVHSPLPNWMGIINITPDSFSDGGTYIDNLKLREELLKMSKVGVQIVDFGAESTRPGATSLSHEEEWGRLLPALETYRSLNEEVKSMPALSLDTRHFETIKKAIAYGVLYVNDVSGLADHRLLDLVKEHNLNYILMHSLSVPADRNEVFDEGVNVLDELESWLKAKLDTIICKEVDLSKVYFDPGLGFGKTTEQSLSLIKKLEKFYSFHIKILMGHSRKSFIGKFSQEASSERDFESIGLSMNLANRGVDILRVHKPDLHIRAHKGYLYGS